MAEQSQDPAHPDPEAGEAGLGPGEHGDSIEDARKGKDAAKREQGGDDQDSDDEG
jgi:hypothetical protein